MDEAWERAVETALDGQVDASSAPRTLTLDGVVKCLHGRLPPPSLLERFQSLEHLSLANIGLSSLEKFPRLRNLQRLILSDNRIAGGLEFLVEAELASLRDLDLSNNRIQYLEDLEPLAQLRLVSLDLYECPVTRVRDYRSKVFGLIRTLKYLDKMDADENERPETDDEDEEDEDEDEEEDPGNGEVDGEERVGKTVNGVGSSGEAVVVVDLDEDEESDADEEETDAGGTAVANGSSRGSHHNLSNGFRVAVVGEEQVEDEDGDDDEYIEDDDEDLGEEIDEVVGEDEDVVGAHEIEDSVEEDGVAEEDDDEDDEVEDEEEEDVQDGEEDRDRSSTGRLTSAEGEIDGHDLGEEDENGEIGEENGHDVEEDREYDVDDGEDEDDFESEYLIQPIRQPELEAPEVDAVGSDLDAGNDEDSEEEVDDDNENPDSMPGSSHPSSSFQLNKRIRDDEDKDGDAGLDDSIEDSRSSKRR